MKQIEDTRIDRDYFKNMEAEGRRQELEDHEVISTCCKAKIDEQQLCSACKDHCVYYCRECHKQFYHLDEH